MWENEEERNKRVRNILIIVAVVLFVALAAGIFLVRSGNKAVSSVLQQSSSVSQEVSDKKNAEAVAQVNADYEEQMNVVATYLPGIVCWGDKLTGGSQGSVSFASALQDLIDENICDLYNFRDTLGDYADNVSRVDWTDYTVEIPVVNMGVGEETTNTILGRNGAVPYVLKNDITIPADCEPVLLNLISENGKAVLPLTAGDGGVNPVTINGIEGTLALSNTTNSQYTFTRLEKGKETLAEAGTEVITAAESAEYRNYIPVIFIGTYGGFTDVQNLIDQNKAIIDHQLGPDGRYIVLGVYEFKNGAVFYISTYDDAMKKAFGDRFISLHDYLTSDAADDLGIKLTDDEILQANVGNVPESLRSTSYSLELSAKVYKQLGQVIYDRMDTLGYFDEVNEKLGIDDVVAQIKQAELDNKLNGNG